MTQQIPTFSPNEFELRNVTPSWFTNDQQTAVNEVEGRVNSQINFIAQMLGFSGANYWGNLPDTISQKRQLLGGTFGVYNSYVIPRIYEVRNWDETIVVDRLEFVRPGQRVYVESVELGYESYTIQNVITEGDKFVVSLGPLPDSFYQQLAANVPLKVNAPEVRPAPFYRPQVGISGDASFNCGVSGTILTIYPAWDSAKQFPYLFPIFYENSTYYFNQPVYLSYSSTPTVNVASAYDATAQKWFLTIPKGITENLSGTIAYIVCWNSDSFTPINAILRISIVSWKDPSDWGNPNILRNFIGMWGNKGGPLPFNGAFDSLSIHGFSEAKSLFLPEVQFSLNFNEIVNKVYAQKVSTEVNPPGSPKSGELWWSRLKGTLALWDPGDDSCSAWVDIDYRDPPSETFIPSVTYPSVATWEAAANTWPVGTTARILDITGLTPPTNLLAPTSCVIGVGGILSGPGIALISKTDLSPYWEASEFIYATLADWEADCELLPVGVPITVMNVNGLYSIGSNYTIENLSFQILGDYSLTLTKISSANNWKLSSKNVIPYIADSGLASGPVDGQMWWDFSNPDPNTRAAAIYISSPSPIVSLELSNAGLGLADGAYTAISLVGLTVAQGTGATVDLTITGGTVTSFSLNSPGDGYSQGNILTPDPVLYPSITNCAFTVTAALADSWAQTNSNPVTVTPTSTLNLSTVAFYCNGTILTMGNAYLTSDYSIIYSLDNTTGFYQFTYTPISLQGRTLFPTITISDTLTSAFTSDITDLVFSGVNTLMSPNVADAETTLRLWKAEALQEAETRQHLLEENFPNPLIADINKGPGAENWERYFIRLPLDYGRNNTTWQKVALICQDFAYWGSSIEPELMDCPPEQRLPAIYEELFLYDQPIPDYEFVYCEPYLYSNVAYYDFTNLPLYLESFDSAYDRPGALNPYDNSGVFPTTDFAVDEFFEAQLIEYEPLHNRQANVTSPYGAGYGDWQGVYVNVNPCVSLTGYLTTDLLIGGVIPEVAPIWDASIYKFAPTCDNSIETYAVDANHYKLGYAYFIADASAAEEGFFDIQQEAAWRSAPKEKSLYMVAA